MQIAARESRRAFVRASVALASAERRNAASLSYSLKASGSNRKILKATGNPMIQPMRPSSSCSVLFNVPQFNFHSSCTRLASGGKVVEGTAGIIPFNLADIGEGITEVVVVQWFVQPGETVRAFDRLCEVESDKANVEITSRYNGKIVELCWEKGQIAKVGQPLIMIDVGGSGNETATKQPTAAAAPQQQAAAPQQVQQSHPAAAAAADADDFGDKVLTVPAVRRIAKESNVDLRLVKGTGKGGRIMKEDILQFIANGGQTQPQQPQQQPQQQVHHQPQPQQPQQPQPQPATAAAGDTVHPLTGYMRSMAKTMGLQTQVPHFGFGEEMDMDMVIALRDRLKPLAEKQGVKFSYLPLLVKSLSLALKDYPQINAKAVDGGNALMHKVSHNIGLAMDTPTGLVVPNIKDVQDKSLLEIAREINRLAASAREGKVTPGDLSGGTITISNIGVVGGTYCHPVLLPGELAIVALGRIQRLPRFGPNDEVIPKSIMTVRWSADHRYVDGMTIALLNRRWGEILTNLETLLLHLK